MLQVEPIPAFADNYIWALHDGAHAAFVDPGEAPPILAWLEARRTTPIAILITHHHGDHTGGCRELLEHFPMPVYGPRQEGIPVVDHPLGDGDTCTLPALGAEFAVIAVPGHTLGHIAFAGHGYLFCGDTLFSCGCGRVFEGTPAMLQQSLHRLTVLPEETLVCCAHEYTLANIRFARHVDPGNAALIAWQEAATALRRAQRPTLPVRLADETGRNPFLRCHDPALRARVEALSGEEQPTEAALFATLRRMKNDFR